MAKKTKKISINALENATKDNYSETTTVEWNGLDVEIRRNITLTEMLAIVDNVVKACFSEQDGKYMPELKDFAVRAAVVELYTNLSAPSNIHKRYDLLYASDIWNVILNNIDMDQFVQMTEAIEKKMNHIANESISVIGKQISSLGSAVEDVQQKLYSLFDGIGSDEMKSFIDAMSSGAIDERKIVEAVLAADKARR